MKLKYFASAIMAMALAGCSNEDVLVEDNQQGIQEGEKTYLSIAIDASNAISSRGIEDIPAYDEANLAEEEGAINTVSLFFFNKEGNAVTPNTNDDGKTQAGDGSGFFNATTIFGWESVSGGQGNANVETTGNAVVSFMNLENRNTPTSVLVVLNLTEIDYNKYKNSNLNSLYAALLGGDDNADGTEQYYREFEDDKKNDVKRFLMSNSVYMTTDNKVVSDTKIEPANFGTSVNDAKAKAVEVYVERLAAKVELQGTTTGTVEDQLENSAAKTYSIKVTGWGLNAQNKSIYLFKQLDNTWTDNALWSNWNKASDYRSYWAKDYNYDKGNYPENYKELYTGESFENSNEENLDKVSSLNYYSYNDLIKEHTTVSTDLAPLASYCNENTLDRDADEVVAATSVLVCAELGYDDDGNWTKAGNLFYFGGQYLDFNNYKTAAAAAMAPQYTGYWIKNSDNGYRNIAPDDFSATTDADLKDLYDGYVSFELKDNTTLYTADDAGAEPGKEGYEETAVDAADVTAKLDEITKANGYNGGKMYYSIPIEHLNNEEAGDGDYGVVRNHWYEVTISNIKTIGKGVWNPDERIVPNSEETKYFLASKINVLSWHKVKQNEDL